MPSPPIDSSVLPRDGRPNEVPAPSVRSLLEVLGPEHLDLSTAGRDRYARTTSAAGSYPLAIAYPESAGQIQQIVGIAREQRLALYPISRGRNWGYGDACAPGDSQIILDLSRMNRIVEVHEELGYAVIEPGVTQGELYEYLRSRNLPFWLDVTGAGLEASIVGNTLDRGFGHTPYGDHFLTACGMQVVLADGRVLNTGFGHYAGAKAERVYRYGVGPFLDGLFAQSSFGIVTRLGLWLMPAPEDFCAFFIAGQGDGALEEIIQRLGPLRRAGILRSAIHIANDLRVLSARMRYPWERAGGATPLPAPVRSELRREAGIGAWNASGGIYGTRQIVAATRREVRRALGPLKPIFLNDRRLALARKIAPAVRWTGWGRRMAERIEIIGAPYGLLKGIPSNEPLQGAAWRVRDVRPEHPVDPLELHAGLMWVSPVVPTAGSCAREVMSLIAPIYERFGFEPLVTFTMISERAMCCVTNLAFDKRDADETGRARECYSALIDCLMRSGYPPYRTGPAGMRKLRQGSAVFWDVVAQIKDVLDPEHIISPGRYEPAAHEA